MRVAPVLVLAGLILGSCTYTQDETQPSRLPAAAQSPLPDSGEELYQKDCAWCHGNEGDGTRYGPEIRSGTNGPALTDFVLSTGRMPLESPQQTMARRDSVYTHEQIDAIVDYTRSFGAEGPEIPDVAPERVDIARGLELYQENCAACHSTTGIGGALTQGASAEAVTAAEQTGVLAPPVTAATMTEVAEAIRTGPGTMPVFGEETFDDADVNAIVEYVEYLKEPDDRGGAPIGRVGPVAEGAVGWIVGLGLLLIFCRWIGTRRGEL